VQQKTRIRGVKSDKRVTSFKKIKFDVRCEMCDKNWNRSIPYPRSHIPHLLSAKKGSYLFLYLLVGIRIYAQCVHVTGGSTYTAALAGYGDYPHLPTLICLSDFQGAVRAERNTEPTASASILVGQHGDNWFYGHYSLGQGD
jgi:hypothetical protein